MAISNRKGTVQRDFQAREVRGTAIFTKAGKEFVVVLSLEQYRELTLQRDQPKTTLIEFFRSSPLVGADLDFERDPD